jgi:hypothetical protein
MKKIVHRGSSETTRGAPFIINQASDFAFNDYLTSQIPEHINQMDLVFLEWFIGMVEGDGTFYYTNQNQRLRFGFQIAQKDPKVLYKIKKTLGFGIIGVFQKKNENYYKYSVEDKKNLQRIMVLFNGNLVLPKRRLQFERWINKASAHKLFPDGFHFKKSHVSVSVNSAWLSGFIDAEGCFYAKTSLATPGNRNSITQVLKQKIHITQQDTHGEKEILRSIGFIFQSTAKVYLIKKKTNCHRIEISSLKSHLLIIDYLEKFPLRTLKYISFHRWRRIVNARILGLHLVEANIAKLTRLCFSINQWTKKYEQFQSVVKTEMQDDLENSKHKL